VDTGDGDNRDQRERVTRSRRAGSTVIDMRPTRLVLTVRVEISQPGEVARVGLRRDMAACEYEPAVRIWEFPPKPSQFDRGARRVVGLDQQFDNTQYRFHARLPLIPLHHIFEAIRLHSGFISLAESLRTADMRAACGVWPRKALDAFLDREAGIVAAGDRSELVERADRSSGACPQIVLPVAEQVIGQLSARAMASLGYYLPALFQVSMLR